MRWQEKVQRPDVYSGDIIIQVVLVKLGGTKTMKFSSDTLISDAVKRIASGASVVAANYGLYRRSGLPLNENESFAAQEVAAKVSLLNSLLKTTFQR
jgi:hypothetical protein